MLTGKNVKRETKIVSKFENFKLLLKLNQKDFSTQQISKLFFNSILSFYFKSY